MHYYIPYMFLEVIIDNFKKVELAEKEAENIKENAYSDSQKIIEEAKKKAAQILIEEQEKTEKLIDEMAVEKNRNTAEKIKEIDSQKNKDIKSLKDDCSGKTEEASKLILKGILK